MRCVEHVKEYTVPSELSGRRHYIKKSITRDLILPLSTETIMPFKCWRIGHRHSVPI